MPEITKEMFRRIEVDKSEAEVIARPSINFWQDAWRRLKMNNLAMFGLGLIIFLVVMALFGPYLVPYTYDFQVLEDQNQGISAAHWFGTDDLGRDIFVRIWNGGRVSLLIGLMAALSDLIIGVIYGGLSGYRGGKIDQLMMRIVDVLYALPYLLVVILMMVVMETRGIITIIMALAATGWVGMARLVRGQILQLKEMEFVLAARTLGASTKRLLFKHLIPNSMGPIIVNMTLTVPSAIFAEAFLSFIGLGVQAPLASWGTMVNEGVAVMLSGYWWRLFFPAVMISLTMFAFNVFGDGLRDALDPKLRK
ncbi:diguanylate cyclase [Vulcanibacillus modesticaldus]|uniref:Diguanylate cyclase n=1 Tax=Vulcanibacillus modesticaldus TaxID=337097 RepID=A0A1D2YWU2_9BACI|nr:ABC transporter permease [Vulcanibacillus modesticaldus]OEG00087.1 diguanylate cyclase [Vulcanibacillus modesticaldus]